MKSDIDCAPGWQSSHFSIVIIYTAQVSLSIVYKLHMADSYMVCL